VNTFCTNCGTTLHPDTNFCAKCGTKRSTMTPTLESSGSLSAAYFAEDGSRQLLPTPPSLHWGIVLLLTVVTLGIFGWVWAFFQAIWVKRLTGTWRPLIWLSVPFSLTVFATIMTPDVAVPSSLGWLFVLGVFSMKRHVVKHYNTVEPIDFKLGGWKTFFGSICYLQYHFTRIARLKQEQPYLFAPYAKPFPAPDKTSDEVAADMQPEVLHG
jgi:hypothetical protein